MQYIMHGERRLGTILPTSFHSNLHTHVRSTHAPFPSRNRTIVVILRHSNLWRKNFKLQRQHCVIAMSWLLACIHLGAATFYFIYYTPHEYLNFLKFIIGIYFIIIAINLVIVHFVKNNPKKLRKIGLLHLWHSLLTLALQLYFHVSIFFLEKKQNCPDFRLSHLLNKENATLCEGWIPSQFLLFFVALACPAPAGISSAFTPSSGQSLLPRFSTCNRLTPYSFDDYFSPHSIPRSELISSNTPCMDPSLLFYHFPSLQALPRYSQMLSEGEWRVIDLEVKQEGKS